MVQFEDGFRMAFISGKDNDLYAKTSVRSGFEGFLGAGEARGGKNVYGELFY